MSRVTGLTIYPVKGCKGVNVKQARICSTGFQHDRCWTIVQEKNGKFESQRKDPKMALIETALRAEEFLRPEASSDSHLQLSVPGQEELKIPLHVDPARAFSRCNVWDWTGDAIDEGDYASEYLSDFMGMRLMRYAGKSEEGTPEENAARRALDPKFAPQHTETAFSDAMPFMVANEASLEELNSRCPEYIAMNRFRPNIVVAGPQPWEEDVWQQLKIGSIQFLATMPNGRCTVTTVDQETGQRSDIGEPLKTLGTYRKGSQLGWDADRSWKALTFFGWYYLTQQQGTVSVGDAVEVMKKRDGPPLEWTATSFA